MRHAFKEWAVICRLLAEGWQTLILRKGGIQEGPAGFQVEQERFWLFPTYSHQQASGIVSAALPVLEKAQRDRPGEGLLRLSHYAEVADVHHLTHESQALALGGLHFWSDDAVRQRFHYRQPGLFALVVRIFGMSPAIQVPAAPAYDGCRSWVTLDQDLAATGAAPVLSDGEFAHRRALIHAACGSAR